MNRKILLIQISLMVVLTSTTAVAAETESSVTEALRRVESGKPREALMLIDEAVKKGDKTADSLAMRARCLNDLKRYAEAIAAANEALALNKDCGVAYHARGMAYWNQRKDDQALADMKKAVLLVPRFAHAHAVMSQIHADHNRFAESMKEARQALSYEEHYSDCACIFAYCAFQLKQYDVALDALTKQLKHDPADLHARRVRVVVLNGMKMWEQQIEDITYLLRFDPKDFSLWHGRAEAYMVQGKWTKAIPDLDRALDLVPKSAHAMGLRASANLNLKRYEEAVRDAELAMKLDPKYPDAYKIGSEAYCKLDQPQKAMKILEPMKTVDEAGYYRLTGNCLKQLHRYEEALQNLSRAVVLNPKEGANYLDRGQIYEEMIEDKKAFADYSRAVELMPDSDQAVYLRNKLAREVGRADVAAKALGKKVKTQSHDPAVKLEYAKSLVETGKHAQAIAILNELAGKSTDYAVFGTRATCYMTLRQYERAIADFNTCLKLSSGSWKLFKNRAECYAAVGRYPQAIKDFSEAIRRKPMVTSVYRDRAQIYERMGDHQAAKRDRQRAAELERDL